MLMSFTTHTSIAEAAKPAFGQVRPSAAGIDGRGLAYSPALAGRSVR